MKRFFDFIPAGLAWLTIILMFVLSRLTPAFVAIFIILFDIYWLLKTIFLSLHLRSAFQKMRANLNIDWLLKLKKEQKRPWARWSDIYHLIILPMYKEPYEVLKESFASLAQSNYPVKEKFIVVLAPEERAGENTKAAAERIKKEFSDRFFKFFIVFHPAGLPDEIPGKGSNQNWALKKTITELVDPLGLDYEKVLVSVFDVDTQIPPDYFGRLVYVFGNAPRPQRASYQPIPLFVNNIFEAPALARVISFSSSFWQMMQQARPERLTTFSSHSMPLKALTEIGFWHKDIVSEDSRIFWQCFLHYNGDWRVEPMYYPVYMDAAVAPTFSQTMINLYKQQRRWGWGCENIPYLLSGFARNKNISFRKKIYWTWNVIEGFHSWATNALLIFALGWLPLFLGGPAFNATILSYNLPFVTKTIVNLAMFGIASSAVLSILLLPPKPAWFKKRHYFLYFIQWLLMPLTLIVFGAIPGLEAQTRLLLGGRFRLGFWVTPKIRQTVSASK